MQPLALVFYKKLLPGSQLVNRLQDLNYRVQTVSDATELVKTAEQVKPIIVLADLGRSGAPVARAIADLRENANTQHLPVIAFGPDKGELFSPGAKSPPGVTLLVSDTALLSHLSQFLDQALQVD